MTESPKSIIPHVVIVGRRNAGKSSLINALSGQELAIVSAESGTTTDPVEKKIELLPFGPILLIDTAGLDDEGEMGKKRIKRSEEMLSRADLIIILADALIWDEFEDKLLEKIKSYGIPYIIAVNAKDKNINFNEETSKNITPHIIVSPKSSQGILELKNILISKLQKQAEEDNKKKLIADLLPPNALVLFVVPIDSGAPKGRLILPQAQCIRECLDENKVCIVITEKQLAHYQKYLAIKPSLVVCDSQIVKQVEEELAPDLPLTTFSILMARYKGDLEQFAKGTKKLSQLRKGSKVLIMEACSHHPQKDDIGRVKIPKLLKKFSGKELDIHFHSGRNFPEDEDWDLIIHCGACMLNGRQMRGRQKWAKDKNIAMTNYGMTISKAQGVLERSMAIFPDLLSQIQE